jgi:hypothetical protein
MEIALMFGGRALPFFYIYCMRAMQVNHNAAIINFGLVRVRVWTRDIILAYSRAFYDANRWNSTQFELHSFESIKKYMEWFSSILENGLPNNATKVNFKILQVHVKENFIFIIFLFKACIFGELHPRDWKNGIAIYLN